MNEREIFEEEDFEILKRRIKTDADRKIFQQVFDAKTLNVIQEFANKGIIDVLEHIISTGKEAHVFIATDVSGNKRAVKIFKKETTHFKKMNEYIEGDIRFRDLRKDRQSLVSAWTKKEYKNLIAASKAKLPVPLPIAFKENVLVMEFIGEGDIASLRLKDTKPTQNEFESCKEQIIHFIAGLYLANLVHADFSEYNILVKNGKLIVIDFAQAVLLNHPKAKEFFERDIYNIAQYFTKNKLKISYEELYEKVKEEKDKLKSKASKKP